jgi:hypothetical protein
MTAGTVLALLGVVAVSFEAPVAAPVLWVLALYLMWHGG